MHLLDIKGFGNKEGKAWVTVLGGKRKNSSFKIRVCKAIKTWNEIIVQR